MSPVRINSFLMFLVLEIVTVYLAFLWKAMRLSGNHKPPAQRWGCFGLQGNALVKIKGLGKKNPRITKNYRKTCSWKHLPREQSK